MSTYQQEQQQLKDTPECPLSSTPHESNHIYNDDSSKRKKEEEHCFQETPLVMIQSPPSKEAREYNTAMSKSIIIMPKEDNQKVSLINEAKPKQEAKKYVSMPLNQKQSKKETSDLAQFQVTTEDSKDGDQMLVDESLDFLQNPTKLQEILAQVAVNSNATPQPVSNMFIEGITSHDSYKAENMQAKPNVVNHKTSSMTINGISDKEQRQSTVRNKQQNLFKAGIYVPNNQGVVVPEKTERKHIQHLLQGLQQTYLGIPPKQPHHHNSPTLQHGKQHHLNASTAQNWNGSSTITLNTNSNRKEVNKTNTIPLDKQPPIFADSLFSTQLQQLDDSYKNQRYEVIPHINIKTADQVSPKLAQVPEIILKSPSLIGAGQTKRPAKIQINKANFQSLPSNTGALSPMSVQSSHLTQASLIHQAQDEKMRQAFQIYRKPAIDHNKNGTRGHLNGSGNNIAFENIERAKMGSLKNNMLKGAPGGQGLSKSSRPEWAAFPSKPSPSSGNISFGPQQMRTLNGDQRSRGQRNGNITFNSAQMAMPPSQQDQQYKIDSHSLPWMRAVDNKKLAANKTRDVAITGNTSRLRAQPQRVPSSIPPIQSQNQSPQPQKRLHAITTGEYQKAFNNSTSKRHHHKLSQLLKMPTSPTSNESPESLIRLPLNNNVQNAENSQIAQQRKSKLFPNNQQNKAKQSSHQRNTAIRVSLTADIQETNQNHLQKQIGWNSSLSPSGEQSTESLPAAGVKLHNEAINTKRRYQQNSRHANNISIQQNVNNTIQQQNKATFVVSHLRASLKSDNSQNQAKKANVLQQSSTDSQDEEENWQPATISQQDLTPWEGAEQSFEHNSKRPEKIKDVPRSNNGAFSQSKNNTNMYAKGCLNTSIQQQHADNQSATPKQGIKYVSDNTQQTISNFISNKKQQSPQQIPLLPKISQLPQQQNSGNNIFQRSGGVVPQPVISPFQQVSGSFDIPNNQLPTPQLRQQPRISFGSHSPTQNQVAFGFYSPSHLAVVGGGGGNISMTSGSQQYIDQTQTLNKILEFNKHMEWQMEVMKRKINGLSKRLKQNGNDQMNGSFKSKSVKFQLPLQRVTTQEVSAEMEEDSSDFAFGTFSVQSTSQIAGVTYNT